MIVTDEKLLRIGSTPVATYAEGMEIVEKLLEEVKLHKNAAGLSAIQIGIPKSVFIYWNSKDKVWTPIINPEIDKIYKDMVQFTEGCLSFPGVTVRTNRAGQIAASSLEEDGEMHLYVYNDFDAVVFQHEFDHLFGKLMFDHRVKPTAATEAKIGRNDPCPCGSGKKYKKCCWR